MKKLFLTFIFFSLILVGQSIAQNRVSDLFQLKCGICHTIGGGKLVGPDLANVQDRRTDEWLLPFIRSSQTVINSGDQVAVALFEENNKVVMPDPMISDTEIKSILDYITENSGADAGTTAEVVSIIKDATPEDMDNGRNLFEGRTRFANGGPSCITCHNDLSSTLFSENSYSTKDISLSFSNLGEAGVKAILENPPFPIMTKAFEGHDLEEKEVHDLLVFLKSAGTQDVNKAQLSSGYLLFGILGSFALLVLYTIFWSKRKTTSVNHNIYKRQVRSFN